MPDELFYSADHFFARVVACRLSRLTVLLLNILRTGGWYPLGQLLTCQAMIESRFTLPLVPRLEFDLSLGEPFAASDQKRDGRLGS